MVGQHLEPHDVVPGRYEPSERLAFLNRIGDSGHHHMADDDLDPASRELIAERDDVVRRAARELFVPLRVAVLDVEQDKIGLREHLLEALGTLGVIRVPAAVQARICLLYTSSGACANRARTASRNAGGSPATIASIRSRMNVGSLL